MGSVDLVVVQVAPPRSPAAACKRVGRAGHQVGEISQGFCSPNIAPTSSAVLSAQRMIAGEIETMRIPANLLDVLAQHTVAACALNL